MEIETNTLILMITPLLLLEGGLKIWALVALSRAERVRWCGKGLWAVIILLVNLFGAAAFLLMGRDES